MTQITGSEREPAGRGEAPSNCGGKLRLIGPGLVVAATGAGDMVTSLTAGTQFGTVLVWAIWRSSGASEERSHWCPTPTGCANAAGGVRHGS